MIKIIKEEIEIDESLVSRLNVICDFCNTTPIIENGSIRKIEHTNLTYIEPHRIIINNKLYLAFNYSNEIYIHNLGKKIKLSELEQYIKEIILFNSAYNLTNTSDHDELVVRHILDSLAGYEIIKKYAEKFAGSGETVVIGQENAHLTSLANQCAGQSIHHVSEATGFDKRIAF